MAKEAEAPIKLKVDERYLLRRVDYMTSLLYTNEKYEPEKPALMNHTFLGCGQILMDQPTVIEIKDVLVEDVVVIGDTHGDMIGMLKKWQYAKIRLEQSTNTKVIFLGDYVDRGDDSLGCVELVSCLQQLYPDQVILLRGNHEMRKINKRGKNCFLDNCKAKYKKKEDGIEVYENANDLFEFMSLMVIIGEEMGKKILFLHGFIDSRVDLNELRKIVKPIQISKDNPDWVVVRLLWNDPCTEINISVDEEEPFEEPNHPRHVGLLVNKPAAVNWMDANGIAIIYRGHQFIPIGVEICFDDRVVTVFSANRYEGRNNTTAMIRIRRDWTRCVIYFREVESANDKVRVEEIPTEYELNDAGKRDEANKKGKDQGKETNREQKGGKNGGKENEPKSGKKNEPKRGKKDANLAVQKAKGVTGKTTENGKEDVEKKVAASSSTGGSSIGSLPVVSLVGSVFVMIIAFSLFGTITAAPSLPSNNFSQFATNSSTLARFVNGISLGQSISAGNLDKQKLIDELFYLGPDVTLDSLAASKISQLADDFASIQEVIDKECSGVDGCGVSKSILNGMSLLDGLKSHFLDVKNALGVTQVGGLDDLTSITIVVDQIKNIRVQTWVEDLENLNNGTTPDKARGFIAAFKIMEQLSQVSMYLNQKPKLITNFKTTSVSEIKRDLNSIKPMVTVSKALYAVKDTIALLKRELIPIENKYHTLANLFRKEALQDITTKIDLMMDVEVSAFKDRNLTPGFLRGFDDLVKLATDVEDSWLQNFLNSDGNSTALTFKVASLKNLTIGLDSLNSKFQVVDTSSGFLLWNSKSLLSSNAGAISQSSLLISSFHECIRTMDAGWEFNNDMENILANLNISPEVSNVLDGVDKFLSENKVHFATLSSSVDTLVPFSTTANFPKLDAVLQSSSVLKDTIDALKKLKTSVDQMQFTLDPLSTWLKNIQIGSLIKDLASWNSQTQFVHTMKCFIDRNLNEKIPSLNPSAENLATLKSGNEDVKSIINFAKSLDELSSEWTKLKPTLSTKSKRAAESNLENAQKISKDLGDISSITLKLDGMLKSKSVLNTLIGGKQAIESAIGEVKDQKEQDRLKKMWTPENLAALQKNLATAKAVSDVVSKNKIVGNMTDFKAPFEKASEVQGCSIDIKRLASSLKGMIKDQTVATSLEASKNLDLQFVKYEQTRVGGVITGLQSYFDSVFGVKGSKLCDPEKSSCSDETTPESSDLLWWHYLLIVLGVVAVFVVVVVPVYYRCFKKEKPEVTPPDDIKIITPTDTTINTPAATSTPAPEKPKKTPAVPAPSQPQIHPIDPTRMNDKTIKKKKKEITKEEKEKRAVEREQDRKEAEEECKNARVKVRKNTNGHFLITPLRRPFVNSDWNSDLGIYQDEFSKKSMDETTVELRRKGVTQEQIIRYWRKRKSECERNAKFTRFQREEPMKLVTSLTPVHMNRMTEYSDNHPIVENPDKSVLFANPINSVMILYGAVEEFFTVALKKITTATASTKTCVNSSKDIRTEDTQASEKENTRTATDNSTRTAAGSESVATDIESDGVATAIESESVTTAIESESVTTAIESDSVATAIELDWVAMSMKEFEAAIYPYVASFFVDDLQLDAETSGTGAASDSRSVTYSSSNHSAASRMDDNVNKDQSQNATRSSSNHSVTVFSSASDLSVADQPPQVDDTEENDGSQEPVSLASVASIAPVPNPNYLSPEKLHEKKVKETMQKFMDGEWEVKKRMYPYGMCYIVAAKELIQVKLGMKTLNNDYKGYYMQEMAKYHKV